MMKIETNFLKYFNENSILSLNLSEIHTDNF